MAIVVSERAYRTSAHAASGAVRRLLVGAVLAVSAVLSACDMAQTPTLVVGVAAETDVRARYGRPEIVWEAADGTRELQFPDLPDNTVTRLVIIGPEGRLREIDNARARERLAKVTEGWRTDDVRRWLGRPSESMRFALSGVRQWRWRVRDAFGEPAWFEVQFDTQGVLLEASMLPDAPDENAI